MPTKTNSRYQFLYLFLATLFFTTVKGQQTAYYTDVNTRFNTAKEYFQREYYSLAYPLFKEIKSYKETDWVNTPITVQEIDYYYLACGLMQNESLALPAAEQYIDVEKNMARGQMLSFFVAEYYFRQQDFVNALQYYDKANIANLSNKDISTLKFHKGYSYFTQKQFTNAKPLFNTIRAMRNDPNYMAANYYYGYIAFRDKQYGDALNSFRIVENDKEYGSLVPYYIAQIYYIQGKKDEALKYAEAKLKAGNAQYYDLELKQMVGHAYFERNEFDKALPYLEQYVSKSDKVRREDLYELSYCYYQAGNLKKSIDGFKQLSGKEDALSQNAMYLLGDAYLKTGQKTNARNAFLFCAANSTDKKQQEISKFHYAKLSYELGYQNEALTGLKEFIAAYPQSNYTSEAKDLLVAVLANTNNYKEALSQLEKMASPTENTKKLYPRILYGRAAELINDGRLQDADDLLNKALQDPNSAPVLPYINFWKGEIAYRNNKLDDALKYYNAYITAGYPANGEANATHAKYNLGYSYLRKENYTVAKTFFEPLSAGASLGSTELVQDAYIRTADCYYMLKDFAKAKTMYENVVKFSWPAEDYATFQLAMLGGVRSAKEKIALLSTMSRKFPTSSLYLDANMEIANAYMADEKFNDAIPYLTNVLKATGNNSLRPAALLQLGTAYFNLNNNNEALKQYKLLIDQYPNSPEAEDAYDNIKAIYLEQGKASDYADFMRKAGKPLSVSTEDSLAFNVAQDAMDKGNSTAALPAFQNYLRQYPNGNFVIDAYYYIGDMYQTRKDWNNALSAYEQVASRAPNNYAERSILAAARISFFELKKYDQAEKYYNQLVQIASTQENKLEAMRGLLRSQYQLEKWQDAAENAKALAATKGASADDKALANMALAKSYYVNGQYDLAIATYKSVVNINKAALAAEARYSVADCLFRQNKLADAEKAAFETIKKAGSYDYWITSSYILLGEIYIAQKDYFNAKATLQSVVENSLEPNLKAEAQELLNKAIQEEKKGSKVGE